MITLEINKKSDNGWNERLLNSPLGTIYHTKEYASVQELLNRKPLFLKFINQKGDIIGQMLVTIYSRYYKRKKLSSILNRIPLSKNTICYWTFGPVIFDFDFTTEICNELNKFLISNNSIVKGSDHPLSGQPLTHLRISFKVQEWATFLIDLSKNKQELWNNMNKHSARKNIERSEKRGVYVKELTKDNLYLYQEIRKENNPVTLEILESRWDSLKNIGWTGFLAFKDEIPIGGLMISYFNKYLNEWGIARTKKDTQEKFYSQDLLKWKIIEWGINKNFRYFDLTGVNPDPLDEKELGIFRYKEKWGGKLFKFNKISNLTSKLFI